MTGTTVDIYQERYLTHQGRKAQVLAEIIDERHSERKFGKGETPIEPILDSLTKVPSSCDRRAVYPVVYSWRDDKNVLSGFLVGGVGWAHRANHIVLLFAVKGAYKAGSEIEFMPYLDAGVMAQQALLVASSLGYAACIINPNVREEHQEAFRQLFGDDLLCAAIAIGSKYEKE